VTTSATSSGSSERDAAAAPHGTRFAVDSFAPAAVAVRNGYDESLHHAAGVISSGTGELIASLGDPDLSVYPRSAFKPLQATAMVQLGLELEPDLLAIVCASHDGSPEHLDRVRRLLARFELSEEDLRNTPSLPLGAAAEEAARCAGVEPSALQQNCSGKHAGMLATCRINGWPTESYLEDDHPLQVAITSTIVERGARVEHVGIDGCGAPTHVISLRGLAAAYSSVAGSTVFEAMTGWPNLVGGPERDISIWMSAVPGLMAKEGAAAVMAFALRDGRAGAFKIADGSDAARRAVLPEALRRAGVDVDGEFRAARDALAVPVLGHGRPVGEIRSLPWTTES
jgi:L-asparaginase II